MCAGAARWPWRAVADATQQVAFSPHGFVLMWLCLLCVLYGAVQGTLVGRTIATVIIHTSPTLSSPPLILTPPSTQPAALLTSSSSPARLYSILEYKKPKPTSGSPDALCSPMVWVDDT